MLAATGVVSVTLLLAVGSAPAQVIRLQKQASSDPRENVRLGDIATVSGTDRETAESLMNLIIVPEVAASRSVRAEAVLMAVIAQVGPGVLADHLQIAGAASCDIQVGAKVQAAASPLNARQAPPAGARVSPNPTPAFAAANASVPLAPAHPKESHTPQGPTLSQLIIKQLQEDLDTAPENIRVNFDTVNPLLDQPAPAGRQWVLRSLTRTFLGTIQFEAQLVEGPRIVQKFNVQMEVLKRQPVLIAANSIARGDVITKSCFKLDETWLDRKMPTLFTSENDIIGLEADRALTAGTMLDQRDFRPVVMAAQGDVVSVVFLHGNLKVQMKARAMADGKLHDSIQVKNESTNELYDAVLIGKRLAVVGGTLTEAQEQQLRETR